jgi:hypothetical protein
MEYASKKEIQNKDMVAGPMNSSTTSGETT